MKSVCLRNGLFALLCLASAMALASDPLVSESLSKERGRYRAEGSINGVPVQFEVDFQAGYLTISRALAEKLGVAYRQGERRQLGSAQGLVVAYVLLVDEVTVGALSLKDVRIQVLDSPEPATPVLGMSFLGRVSMRHGSAGELILEQRP